MPNLEDLVPFVEFLLTLDRYNEIQREKFNYICTWIKSKKRLNERNQAKIHDLIVSQIKNLLISGVKIPNHITQTFDKIGIRYHHVNLCSDDEDDNDDNDANTATPTNNNNNNGWVESDDDDLIFVSEETLSPKSTSPKITSSLVNGNSKSATVVVDTIDLECENFIKQIKSAHSSQDLKNGLHKESSSSEDGSLFTRRMKQQPAATSEPVLPTISLANTIEMNKNMEILLKILLQNYNEKSLEENPSRGAAASPLCSESIPSLFQNNQNYLSNIENNNTNNNFTQNYAHQTNERLTFPPVSSNQGLSDGSNIVTSLTNTLSSILSQATPSLVPPSAPASHYPAINPQLQSQQSSAMVAGNLSLLSNKINFNDPRILKQMEKIEKLPFCNSELKAVIKNFKMEAKRRKENQKMMELEKRLVEPTTYGDYKRLQAEKQKAQELHIQKRRQQLQERLKLANEELLAEIELMANGEESTENKAEPKPTEKEHEKVSQKTEESRVENPLKDLDSQKPASDPLQVSPATQEVNYNEAQEGNENNLVIENDALQVNQPEHEPSKTKKKRKKNKKRKKKRANSHSEDPDTDSSNRKDLRIKIKVFKDSNQSPKIIPTDMPESSESSASEQTSPDVSEIAESDKDKEFTKPSQRQQNPSKQFDRIFEHLVINFDGEKQSSMEPYSNFKALPRTCSRVAIQNIKEQLTSKQSFRNETDEAPVSLKRRRKSCSAVANENASTEKPKVSAPVRVPIVKLHRLTPSEIAFHTMPSNSPTATTLHDHDIPDVSDLLQVVREEETVMLIPPKPPAKNKVKLRNTNLLMTESSSSSCVLCRSKTTGLTNHYIRIHRTESYVSRLSEEVLKSLDTNIRFAELVPEQSYSRGQRYTMQCAFCNLQIKDYFYNFHEHFSTHTGEYAYQCSFCKLRKPFRKNIKLHKNMSKTCIGHQINILYSYPTEIMTIYLYCCSLCNFVQLNEANVTKHLKDHHPEVPYESVPIKKHILTAQALESKDVYDQNAAEAAASKACEMTELPDNCEVSVSNEALMDEPKASSSPESGDQSENSQLLSTTDNMPDLTLVTKHELCDSQVLQREQSPHAAVTAVVSVVCRKEYKCYEGNRSSFGLFKCMASDCFFSTDASDSMQQHLQRHKDSFSPPDDFLLCPYCTFGEASSSESIADLISHISQSHSAQKYQCEMCFYRSVSPENIVIHMRMYHRDVKHRKVFKCRGVEVSEDEKIKDLYLNMSKNVARIGCAYCREKFFALSSLKQHLAAVHKDSEMNLKSFAYYICIYCGEDSWKKDNALEHLANAHPDKFPYGCYRELLKKNGKDELGNLSVWNNDLGLYDLVDVSENSNCGQDPTTCVEMIMDLGEREPEDVKPDVNDLLQAEEAQVAVLLFKLVASTGVPSNILFQCPIKKCEGFFLNFENWERHMRKRHSANSAACTHCRTDAELPLNYFKNHFENHRHHRYVCFDCLQTFANEAAIKEHVLMEHNCISQLRVEKITPKNSYNEFNVVLRRAEELEGTRNQLLATLKERLMKHLKEQDARNEEKIRVEWLVPSNAEWLNETVSHKRCLFPTCNFIAVFEEDLYGHIKNCHQLSDRRFSCNKCDFTQESMSCEGLFAHLTSHPDEKFLCCVCSFNTSRREQMNLHINQYHNHRDAPVVFCSRLKSTVTLKLSVVFAENQFCFSSIINCFCCESQFRSNPKTYGLHLKNFHKMMMKYYCQHCHAKLGNLQESKNHFYDCHRGLPIKIMCELGTKDFLEVKTLRPLKFSIKKGGSQFVVQSNCEGAVYVKQEEEAEQDSVILLDDDDVFVESQFQDRGTLANAAPVAIKCVDMQKLIDASRPVAMRPATHSSEVLKRPTKQTPTKIIVSKPITVKPSTQIPQTTVPAANNPRTTQSIQNLRQYRHVPLNHPQSSATAPFVTIGYPNGHRNAVQRPPQTVNNDVVTGNRPSTTYGNTNAVNIVRPMTGTPTNIPKSGPYSSAVPKPTANRQADTAISQVHNYQYPPQHRGFTYINNMMATPMNRSPAQPVVGQGQPAVGQTQPAIGQTQPAIGQPQHVIGQAQPVVGQYAPILPPSYYPTGYGIRHYIDSSMYHQPIQHIPYAASTTAPYASEAAGAAQAGRQGHGVGPVPGTGHSPQAGHVPGSALMSSLNVNFFNS